MDDTSSYGPETITMTVNTEILEDGEVIKYSVYDFTNRNSESSNALSLSNATVHVYSGNDVSETYYVPENSIGTVWHVFDIDKSGVKSVNKFYNSDEPTEVE